MNQHRSIDYKFSSTYDVKRATDLAADVHPDMVRAETRDRDAAAFDELVAKRALVRPMNRNARGKYLNVVDDSDATCRTCRHDWPIDIECAICEPTAGPFTKPNHWKETTQ